MSYVRNTLIILDRLMKTYKEYVKNNRYLEGSIAESYIVEEASIYSMEYMPDPKFGSHKYNVKRFLDENDEYTDEGPMDVGSVVTLSQVQWKQVSRWMFQQHDDVDKWRG